MRTANNRPDVAPQQLCKYLAELEVSSVENSLKFRAAGRTWYKLDTPLAEDLNSAPTSQAFTEKIFSLCVLMTAGR